MFERKESNGEISAETQNKNSYLLINDPTCYKNFDNPTRINLILTNRPNYFQHSTVFETGLSDFHLLNLTELKRV